MRYSGEAVRARTAPYPFRWQQRGRSRLLQARLELASGRAEKALAEARDLIADAIRSGDAVRALAARLLEAEALATSGASVDTKAIGEVLKKAGDVLGAEAWRLTARLAQRMRRCVKYCKNSIIVVQAGRRLPLRWCMSRRRSSATATACSGP